MLTRGILGSGRNCIENFGQCWIRMQHSHILYTFIKRWLWSDKLLMKLLCMCLERSCRNVSLTSERAVSESTRHPIPRTQVVFKVDDVCFSFFLLFPLFSSCSSYVYAKHVVLTSTCVAINTWVTYTSSALSSPLEIIFVILYDIRLSCSLLSKTFIRGDSKLLRCQYLGSVVLSVRR